MTPKSSLFIHFWGGSISQIKKWGDSLGIRILKFLILKVGIEEGSEIDFDMEDVQLNVKPKSATLHEILSRITPDNIHNEVSTGGQQGREVC